MKQKQSGELKNKPLPELQKDLEAFRERLNKMRFDLAAGKVKNIKEIKATKKAIAAILTIINEKFR